MKILTRDDTEHDVEYVTRAEAEREIEAWKANHDNQVEIKRIIAARPDLAERAPMVERLIAERDEARNLARELFDLQCWAMLAGDGGDKLPLAFPAWLSSDNAQDDESPPR